MITPLHNIKQKNINKEILLRFHSYIEITISYIINYCYFLDNQTADVKIENS